GGAISRDGRTGYFFDDASGNESGRWVAAPVADPSRQTVLLPELDAATPAGLVPLSDDRVVVGRMVPKGFELAIANVDGGGRVVFSANDFGYVVDVTDDDSHALLAVFRDGDDEHPGSSVIRLADGAVVAEFVPTGIKFDPSGFHPRDNTKVLVTEESTGW